LIGRELIYELTQHVENYLEGHNHKPQSFYDQMIQRNRAQEIADHEKELLEIEKEREEEEALQAMVEQEMKRKELALKLKLRTQRNERLHKINGSGDWPGDKEDGSDADISNQTASSEGSVSPGVGHKDIAQPPKKPPDSKPPVRTAVPCIEYD